MSNSKCSKTSLPAPKPLAKPPKNAKRCALPLKRLLRKMRRVLKRKKTARRFMARVNAFKKPLQKTNNPLVVATIQVSCRERRLKRRTANEPVFGQIKEARRFRRFSLRGLPKVRGEWDLIAVAHNVLKLYRATPR